MSKFIPELWAERALAHFEEKAVFANIVNKEYEGQIKEQGDQININQYGSVTIGDYDPVAGMGDPEMTTSTQVKLLVDKSKFFNFEVGKIEEAQANVSLIEGNTKSAAAKLVLAADTDIAAVVKDAAIKVGTSVTPIQLTKENIYEELVKLSVKLDEANVPADGRFVVLTPAARGLLALDPRFTRNDNVVAGGSVAIGSVAGFEVSVSNQVLKTGTKYSIMAGSDQAVAFVGQIAEMRESQMEKKFSTKVDGLYVYGVKVIRPEALCEWIVEFPAA